MPLKKCSDNKNSGWKWGDSGKCYTGPDAKKKAIRQGVAIEGPKKFQQMASSFEEPLVEDDIQPIIDYLYEEGYRPAHIAATSVSLKHMVRQYGE
tara:strand:+ start:239 stop:523 length:285 start_codon:yes stop_codon:yes gene_type:complete